MSQQNMGELSVSGTRKGGGSRLQNSVWMVACLLTLSLSSSVPPLSPLSALSPRAKESMCAAKNHDLPSPSEESFFFFSLLLLPLRAPPPSSHYRFYYSATPTNRLLIRSSARQVYYCTRSFVVNPTLPSPLFPILPSFTSSPHLYLQSPASPIP